MTTTTNHKYEELIEKMKEEAEFLREQQWGYSSKKDCEESERWYLRLYPILRILREEGISHSYEENKIVWIDNRQQSKRPEPPKKYIIRDREAGNIIDRFVRRWEAEKEIEKYEEQDKKDGVYEENFYELVYEEDDGTLTIVED